MQLAQRKACSVGCARPRATQRCVRVRVAQVETTEAPAAAAEEKAADGAPIYIGFAKGDYAPRAGRKGRVIVDDPSKYPSKEDLGVFAGATGGWAGGEAGLWKLREEVLAEKAAKKAAAAASAAPAAAPAKPVVPQPEGDKAPIYVGYGKSDLEARRSGVPGRFILDDPTLYPAKEDIGFFAGATGGFAAGEAGLKQFVRDGALRLRREGQPGGNFGSPVTTAGLLVAAGVGGGLLLNGVADLAADGIKGNIADAPMDENTKLLLLAAVGLLGAAGLLVAVKATSAALQERAGGAGNLLLAGGAWLAVFVGARAFLEL